MALFAFGFLSSAMAGATFNVAASSSSGTYQKMLGEIIGVCSGDDFNITMDKGVTGGAIGNLDALVNGNNVQAAMLHSDVYAANVQADPAYKQFQTLLALYPEPIHIVALKQSKTSKIGYTSFGKQEFSSLVDTKGFSVGAAGGGVTTARLLQGQGQGGFEVVAFNEGKEVLAALDKGTIAAAVFVGAAPLPNIAALDKNLYKILPIGEAISSRVQGLYRQVKINYVGLTDGPISTMAPMATILTKKYRTGDKVAAQAYFRECFYKHLDELKDNNSPNWQQVEANDQGVLPWYEIPSVKHW